METTWGSFWLETDFRLWSGLFKVLSLTTFLGCSLPNTSSLASPAVYFYNILASLCYLSSWSRCFFCFCLFISLSFICYLSASLCPLKSPISTTIEFTPRVLGGACKSCCCMISGSSFPNFDLNFLGIDFEEMFPYDVSTERAFWSAFNFFLLILLARPAAELRADLIF